MIKFYIFVLIIGICYCDTFKKCIIKHDNIIECNELRFKYYLRLGEINVVKINNIKYLETLVYYTNENDTITEKELIKTQLIKTEFNNSKEIIDKEINNIIYYIMGKTNFSSHIYNSIFSMSLINIDNVYIAKLDSMYYNITKMNETVNLKYIILYTHYNNKHKFILCYINNSDKILDIKCDLELKFNMDFIYSLDLKISLIEFLNAISKEKKILDNNIYCNNCNKILDNKILSYFYIINENKNLIFVDEKDTNIYSIIVNKIYDTLMFYIGTYYNKYFKLDDIYHDICNDYSRSSEFINPYKNTHVCKYNIIKNISNLYIKKENDVILSMNKTLIISDDVNFIINLVDKYCSEDMFKSIIDNILNYFSKDLVEKFSINNKHYNKPVYLKYRLDDYIYVFDNNFIFKYKKINITHYYFYNIEIIEIDIIKEKFTNNKIILECDEWENKNIKYSNNNEYKFLITEPNIICSDDYRNNNCTKIIKNSLYNKDYLFCTNTITKCNLNSVKYSKIFIDFFCNNLLSYNELMYDYDGIKIYLAISVNNIYVYSNKYCNNGFKLGNFNMIKNSVDEVEYFGNLFVYSCKNCIITSENSIRELLKINMYNIFLIK